MLGGEAETPLGKTKACCRANTFNPNLIGIMTTINHVGCKYEFVLDMNHTDKLNPFNWAGVLKMSNELQTLPPFDFPLACRSEEERSHHAVHCKLDLLLM